MMRFALLLALIIIVVATVVPRLRALARTMPAGRPHRRDELVKDPMCQTYVVSSRAIKSEENGVTVHFCSRQCAERYARGERRS